MAVEGFDVEPQDGNQPPVDFGMYPILVTSGESSAQVCLFACFVCLFVCLFVCNSSYNYLLKTVKIFFLMLVSMLCILCS